MTIEYAPISYFVSFRSSPDKEAREIAYFETEERAVARAQRLLRDLPHATDVQIIRRENFDGVSWQSETAVREIDPGR